MVIFRKFKSAARLLKGGNLGAFWDRMPLAKPLFSATNYLPHADGYKYILLGGHGLGMTALLYYLEKMGAKPLEIFSYEIVRPFVFFRAFDGLVMDKAPLNAQAAAILKTCRKKVPCYQLVRDPISSLKSNVNVQMFHGISQIRHAADAKKAALRITRDIGHLAFHFGSMRSLTRHIAEDITYIPMREIDEKNMPQTLRRFALRLGYATLDIASEGAAGGTESSGGATAGISGGISTGGGGGANLHGESSPQTPRGRESVIKGSIFPRCFPIIFSVGGRDFVLSTPSRLEGKSRREIDINSGTARIFRGQVFVLEEDIAIAGYEGYPLVLAALDSRDLGCDLVREARAKALNLVAETIEIIKRHEGLVFSEEELIVAFLEDAAFAKNLAHKIFYELRFLRKEAPKIVAEFAHTRAFLAHFNLEI